MKDVDKLVCSTESVVDKSVFEQECETMEYVLLLLVTVLVGVVIFPTVKEILSLMV